MSSHNFLLAHTKLFDFNVDNAMGRYMSEKLDGVRALWVPHETDKKLDKFYSRNGKEFNVPRFFMDKLPRVILDGELWTKRNDFEYCSGLVRTKIPDPSKWESVTYMVFDAPYIKEPFNKRYEFLCSLDQNNNFKITEQVLCNSNDHLLEYFNNIIENGGEGVMLRDTNSFYEGKRSKTLTKVKPFEDAEGEVIGYEEGTGKYVGLLGALKLKDIKSGVVFNCGSGLLDSQRSADLYPLGTIITYKYFGLTKGTPRFPIFLRIRPKEE